MNVCVLGSGSSGNSFFVSAEGTRVLVDAGLSKKEIMRRLAAIGEKAEDLDAVLVTHEHWDHCHGLPAFLKAVSVPVWMRENTERIIMTAAKPVFGEYTPAIEHFELNKRFSIGRLEIEAFRVPHDAIDPVGFCFYAFGLKAAIVTDLGHIPETVQFYLRGTDVLVLESNHDEEMLSLGLHPPSVIERVAGQMGHLSNDAVGRFVDAAMDRSVSTLVLAHLSEANNRPEIVRARVERDLPLACRLLVAAPGEMTEVVRY